MILIYVFVFYYCDKTPEINNIKEERFILARGFRLWLVGLDTFRPETKQYIIVGGGGRCMVEEVCLPHDGREVKKRERGRAWGLNTNFQGVPPVI